MALSVQKRGEQLEPPRIIIYGPHGVGKSTFGAMAEKPVFVQIEDGLGGLDVDRFPIAKTFDEVMAYITELGKEDHDFKTLVVDSLDWLESLIYKKVIEDRPMSEKGKPIKDITDYGYGAGYTHAMTYWDKYINLIDRLRVKKDMTIIQIAHAKVEKFENPMTDTYDRYSIKLNSKTSGPRLQEHADFIFFCNHSVGVKHVEKGFGQTRTRAIGGGDRSLYTEERPAFVAKRRADLPEEIPFDKEGEYWKLLREAIPYFNQKKEVTNNG